MNMKDALEHPWIKKHEKISIENALTNSGQMKKHLSDFQKYTHVITDSDIKKICSSEENSNLPKSKTETSLAKSNSKK